MASCLSADPGAESGSGTGPFVAAVTHGSRSSPPVVWRRCQPDLSAEGRRRRRTSRPAACPALSVSTSMSRPAGISTGRPAPPCRPARSASAKGPERDFLLHGLVPAQPAGGTERRARPTGVNAPASSAFLGGPASAAGGSAGAPPARRSGPRLSRQSADMSGSSPAPAAAAPGRPQDAELPAGLVLPRRRAVGVQQVPLVEDGIGDGAGQARGPCSSQPAPPRRGARPAAPPRRLPRR